jgi:hypothetical protein
MPSADYRTTGADESLDSETAQNYTKSRATVPTMSPGSSTRRPLPTEIWGHIFSTVDGLTLWVSCRQVSKMLRSEAEPEFAQTRLPHLQIQWIACVLFDHADSRYDYMSCVSEAGVEEMKFMGLEDGGRRVRLRVPVGGDIVKLFGKDKTDFVRLSGNDKTCKPPDTFWLQDEVAQALERADVNFSSALKRSGPTVIMSTLGPFANNNPLPAAKLDLEAKECSFEWKPFLDAFYGDFVSVGKLARPHAPVQAVLMGIEAAEQDFKRQQLDQASPKGEWIESWINKYGELEDSALASVMAARILRAWSKAVPENGISTSSETEAEHMAQSLKIVRNRSIVRDLWTGGCMVSGTIFRCQ